MKITMLPEELQQKREELGGLLSKQSFETETEKFQHKYSTLNLLKDSKRSLEDLLNNSVEKDILVMEFLGYVYLQLGVTYIEVEELKEGEEYLSNCIDLFKPLHICDPEPSEESRESSIPTQVNFKITNYIINAYNELGRLWSQWEDPAKAKEFLEKAEKLYLKWKDGNSSSNSSGAEKVPVEEGPDSADSISKEDEDSIEKLYTHTLYYLGQLNGILKNNEEAIKYYHATLQRQLVLHQENFDPIDWALNAATLSQCFMGKGYCKNARHHLAAASTILKRYEDTLMNKPEEEKKSEKYLATMENFQNRKADVSRCWIKYALLLLCSSYERLMESRTEEKEKKEEVLLRFASLEAEVKELEEGITTDYLLDLEDARKVFLKLQFYVNEAKAYYKFEEHATEYIKIQQDLSQAYNHLAFFEENVDRQAILQKRRIDILEKILSELNQRFYIDTCRLLWMELGEIYTQLLENRLDKLATENSPRLVAKINSHVQNSIKYFELFLKSVGDCSADDFVVNQGIDRDLIRPSLYALFHLGRLYSKFISDDKETQIKNVMNSLNSYKALLSYCEKNDWTKETMKVEMNIAKELVTLLPVKIDRLRNRD